jgi:hypothetical protein
MGLFNWISRFTTHPRQPSSHYIEWIRVSFDDERVYVHAEPSGREPWDQEFPWSSVERICFEAADLFASDTIYVFTSQRPESYVIPVEAVGGIEFWGEILHRGLFDAELAIEAARSDGALYVWPPRESADKP